MKCNGMSNMLSEKQHPKGKLKDKRMMESKWISVKDRLPEPHRESYWFHGVMVFFIMPDGSKHAQIAQWCKNNQFVWNGMNITKYVTNWSECMKPPNNNNTLK